MEQSEHAFLRYLGWSVVQPQAGFKISWPRVAAHCNYSRPIRFEEVFGIQVEVAKVGRSSCVYRFRFLDVTGVRDLVDPAADRVGGWASPCDWFQSPNVRPFAEGSLTAVCCRIVPGESHESIEIPAEWRDKLVLYSHREESP